MGQKRNAAKRKTAAGATAPPKAAATNAAWRRLGSARSRKQLASESRLDEAVSQLVRIAMRDPADRVAAWALLNDVAADAQLFSRIMAQARARLPNPEELAGKPIARLVEALAAEHDPESLTWCVEVLLLRSSEARSRIEQAILATPLTPLTLAISASNAVDRLERRGLRATPGAARAVAELIAQARMISNRANGPFTKAFFDLNFQRDDLKVLLASLVALPAAGDALDALAEQAWTRADGDLAFALQQTPALAAGFDAPDALPRDLRAHMGNVLDAIRGAAHARGMALKDNVGDEVAFDARLHARDDPKVSSGKPVRVIRPAIVQGVGSAERVIRKADVEPIE